jgi:probable HAF family extracellular repeat protein
MRGEQYVLDPARGTVSRSRLYPTLAAAFALTGAVWAAALAATSALGAELADAARPPAGAAPVRTAGFVLDHGKYLPVAAPPDVQNLVAGPLSPLGINDRGQVTGSYLDPTERERGFVLDRNRNKFYKVDVPGAVGTQGQGINNQGQVVGAYSDTGNPSVNGAQLRGFLLDHGRYVRLDYPGAITSQAFGINDRGQVVGEYQAADGTFHGYLWQQGRLRTLPTRGSAFRINNQGQVTGATGDFTTADGYLLDGNRLTTFDAPGAQITIASGINDHGEIVGISFTSRPTQCPPGSCAAADGSS